MFTTIQELATADNKIHQDVCGKLTFDILVLIQNYTKAYGIPLQIVKKIVDGYGLSWPIGHSVVRPGFYGFAEILRLPEDMVDKVLELREAAEAEWLDRSEALRELCDSPELYGQYIQSL
jgi:hypothetical protein